jgi:hypothetical protein
VALLAAYGYGAVAAYMAAMALLTTVSVILAAETYRDDIHEDQPQERRLIAERRGGSTATE